MKRFISLLSLVLLVGILACETDQPTSISGPQLAKGGTATPAVPLMASFRDAGGDSIVSDFVTDPYYDFYGYVDGSCGVVAELAKNSNWAWLFPRYRAIKPKERDCGEARWFDVLLPDTTFSDGWVFMVDGVRQVAPNSSENHRAVFHNLESWKCRFTEQYLDNSTEPPTSYLADMVKVTGFQDYWTVESTGEHRAVCTFADAPTAVLNLPFQLTFTPKP